MEVGKQKTRRKNSEHYVDPEQFYLAMKEYKIAYNKSQRDKTPVPQLSDYIAECFMKIAKKLLNHPWFLHYNKTIQEEMVSDALENVIKYAHNFDYRKSKNPFAYFSQIIWFAYRRRIDNEKAYLYTKYKLAEDIIMVQQTEDGGKLPSPEQYGSDYSDEHMREFISKFEENKRKKKELADKKKEEQTTAKKRIKKKKSKDLRKHIKD